MEDQKLSLVDLVIRSKIFFKGLRARWKWIVFYIVVFSAIGAGYSFFNKTNYIAVTTLTLEQTGAAGGALAGYLQMAGQMGILPGGTATLTNDKLVEILKSRRILSQALLRKARIDSTTDFLGNHLISVFQLRDNLDKDPHTKNFKFLYDKQNTTQLEDSVLNVLCEKIIKKHLEVDNNSLAGIITVKIKTRSELASKYLCNYIVQSVVEYYIHNITEKEQQTVNTIQYKVDSVRSALSSSENLYAQRKDASNRMIKARGYIEELQVKREIEVLGKVYAEGIKNLEMAKFNLLLNTPIVQIIDSPVLPLKEEKIKLPVGIISGGAAGFVIYVLVYTIGLLLSKAQEATQ